MGRVPYARSGELPAAAGYPGRVPVTPFRIVAVLVLALLMAGGVALGRSPRQTFEDRRVVSASGRVYAVLRTEDAKIRLTLHRRREGAAPLAGAIRSWGTEASLRPDIAADPRDAELCSTLLGRTLTHVRVSDEPVGALLLDTDGALEGGAALCFVGSGGRIAWTHRLSDIFKPEELQDPRYMHWDWFRGLWLDGAAFLATKGNVLVRVALADGRLERVGPDVLRERLGVGTQEERELVLELVSEWNVGGMRASAEALAADEGQPLGVRVRAAQVARAQGGTAPYRDLFARAVSPKAEQAVRYAGLLRIVPMLGEDAFDVIVESVSSTYPGDRSLHLAVQALTTLKGPLVPRLDALRRTPVDADTHTLRLLALTSLNAIGTPEARELLWDTLQHGDPVAAMTSFHLLVEAKPEDLRARLVAALKAGSPIRDAIGRHLGVHPH